MICIVANKALIDILGWLRMIDLLYDEIGSSVVAFVEGRGTRMRRPVVVLAVARLGQAVMVRVLLLLF